MGQFSRELCGGTHLKNTEEVRAFEIVSEEGVSAGTRRIVALTGEKAAEYIEHSRAALEGAAQRLECSPDQVPEQVTWLARRVRDLKKAASAGSQPPAAEKPAASIALK